MSKKIISIVSLSVIVLLVVATIALACIPKNFMPINEQPTGFVLASKSDTLIAKGVSADEEIYNKLSNYYENAFKESSINALFNGRIGMKSEVVYSDAKTKADSFGTNYILLNFNADQTVELEDETFTFNKAVISLKSNNVMETVKVYLYNNDDDLTTGTHYHISTIGNLQDLANYIAKI